MEYKKLGEVAEIGTGSQDRKDAVHDGLYPFYVRSKDILRINKYLFDEEAIIIPGEGGIGDIFHYVKGKYGLHQRAYRVHLEVDSLSTKFLYYYFRSRFKKFIFNKAVSATVTSIRKPMLEKFEVPVPPLSVQREIVRILDSFTSLEAELKAELEARRKQYEYYRDQLLSFKHLSGGGKNKVEWKTLPQISQNLDSKRKPIKSSRRVAGIYPYYGASGIVDYVEDYIFDGDFLLVSEDGANLLARTSKIAFSISGKNWVNNHAHVLSFHDAVRRKFVEFYIENLDLSRYISAGAQPKLTKDKLNSIPIPQPPYEKQQEIVSILDSFESLVNDISTGLPAEIAARHQQYEYYRDQLLSFKRKS